MVIDTSAILAILFEEQHGKWAALQINNSTSDLYMSTVNLTETLIIIEDRHPQRFKILEETMFSISIKFIAPDIEQSRIAAKARLHYPLNLGDCFVYALAVIENLPILTVDKDFKSVSHTIIMP